MRMLDVDRAVHPLVDSDCRPLRDDMEAVDELAGGQW